VRILLRTTIGTVIYVGIVYLAAAVPTAAGLMLTFPALNGLAFYFSERARVAPMAATMLWMPIINGALCGLYMLAFLNLAKALPPAALAWTLAIAISALWLFVVSRDRVHQGIAANQQLRFAVAATLAGALLAATVLYLLRADALVQKLDWSDQMPALADVIVRSRLKILLFALCLGSFLLATAYLPICDSLRGVLAGLPIIPFGGLVSVAADSSSSFDARLQALYAMTVTVWLGPAVAIWFICAISRYLGARETLQMPALDAAARFAALVIAWLGCFAAILGVSIAIGRY
jgi:hypothetical protein